MSDTNDVDEIYFITGSALAPGTTKLHKGAGGQLKKSVAEVQEDWRTVSRQILKMVEVSETEATASGFAISEVTVGLGFTAKGKLAFLAEAGVEASIEVTLRRKP